MNDFEKLNDANVEAALASNDAFWNDNSALTIGHGSFAHDKNCINKLYKPATLMQMLSTFGRGVKDGPFMMQGELVPAPSGSRGTQRTAVNMAKNYILMVDFDQGDTIDEIADKMHELGFFAVLWNTHSHMKPLTMVPEQQVLQWLKSTGVSASEATEAQVVDYVKKRLKIYDKFLTDGVLKVGEREMMAGGRHYPVHHAPLPKCRALMLLKDVFNFGTRKGSQQEVITEWKEKYVGFCEEVLKTVAFDPKCIDPSRLMYLPRISDDADVSKYEIRFINGTPIDFEAAPRVGKKGHTLQPTAVGNAFTRAGSSGGASGATSEAQGAADPVATKTSWLRSFLARHGHDFEAETWLKSLTDEAYPYQCPFHETHTPNQSGAPDSGFKAWDASTRPDGGFNMQCSHSCGADPARGQGRNGKQDRAKYLDALIQMHDVPNMDALLEYCPHAAEEIAAREAETAAAVEVRTVETEAGNNDAANEARIRSFSRDTLPEDVQGMVRLLARRPTNEASRVGQLVALLATTTGLRRRDLDQQLTALRREFRREQEQEVAAAADAATTDDPTMTPPDDLSAFVPLWPGLNEAWTEKIVQLSTLRQIERFNREQPTPRLYIRPEGGTMRVTRNHDNMLVVEEMTKDAWQYEITNVVQFKKAGMNGRRHQATPASVVSYVIGAPGKDFPILERVIRVPVISEQGTLVTEPGYDAGLKCYLDPNFKPLPVSLTPTPAQLNTALDLIEEALTDFPFSDVFNGDDKLPLRLEVKDQDGHTLPNFERGQASRANMMALILQPFVQHLIKGSSPAYHIDKASPGTGAGFITDVAFMVSQGTRAVINTMSDNNEEFKKSITATLRMGVPIIFIDNINRKVDSGALAAALTSGVWQDRILGVSENARIEVKCAWVMAGNNLSFSPELMRRNVPIRLDAKLPNPALDRPKDSFKHHPLQDWLLSERPHLVWACLTIVAHWFARGRPKGSVTMNSFDHWAAIMGGILEAAGVPGFLSNIPAYLAEKNDDEVGTSDFVQELWKQFESKEFSPAMALAAAKDPFGNVLYGLPIDPDKNERSVVTWWGGYIKSQLAGRTYRVTRPRTGSEIRDHGDGADLGYNVTWVIHKSGNNSKNRLVRNEV